MVIAELQKRKVFPPLKKLPFNQTGTPGQEKKPADNRSRTIDEMLVTERKYIQDLQALMVSLCSVPTCPFLIRQFVDIPSRTLASLNECIQGLDYSSFCQLGGATGLSKALPNCHGSYTLLALGRAKDRRSLYNKRNNLH